MCTAAGSSHGLISSSSSAASDDDDEELHPNSDPALGVGVIPPAKYNHARREIPHCGTWHVPDTLTES